MKNIESRCDTKHAVASVYFAVLIHTESTLSLAAHHPAVVVESPASTKRGFVIRAGITDDGRRELTGFIEGVSLRSERLTNEDTPIKTRKKSVCSLFDRYRFFHSHFYSA